MPTFWLCNGWLLSRWRFSFWCKDNKCCKIQELLFTANLHTFKENHGQKWKTWIKKKTMGVKKTEKGSIHASSTTQKKIKENLTNKTFKLKHSLLGILLGTILWEATTLVLHKVWVPEMRFVYLQSGQWWQQQAWVMYDQTLLTYDLVPLL